MTIDEKIEQVFLKNLVRGNENDCWDYPHINSRNGYSRVAASLVIGKNQYLRTNKVGSRVSYKHFYGPFDESLLVCHTCDNPRCVNPKHLFLGTDQDNHTDKTNKGRQTRGETHGAHKLTEQEVINIKLEYVKGKRGCGFISLSKKYNVALATIQRIIDGSGWKHL